MSKKKEKGYALLGSFPVKGVGLMPGVMVKAKTPEEAQKLAAKAIKRARADGTLDLLMPSPQYEYDEDEYEYEEDEDF